MRYAQQHGLQNAMGSDGSGLSLEGGVIATQDRIWVCRQGQYVELSKAEVRAHKIACLRARIADATAELADLASEAA